MLKPAIILMSFLLFSTALHANVEVTYSAQQNSYFTMEIPDSWRVNVGSETDAAEVPEGELAPPRVITMMPGDDSILWFGAWVPVYLHSLDAAQEYLSSLNEFLVDNPVTPDSVEVGFTPKYIPIRLAIDINGNGIWDEPSHANGFIGKRLHLSRLQ